MVCIFLGKRNKIHCFDYLNFLEEKFNDIGFLFKVLVFSSIVVIFLSFWSDNISDKKDDIDFSYLYRIEAVDKLISKHDDVRILSTINYLLEESCRVKKICLYKLTDVGLPQQATYYLLLFKGNVSDSLMPNVTSQNEVQSIEYYMENIASSSIAVIKENNERLFTYLPISKSLAEKRNSISAWLIIMQIVNLLVVVRMFVLDKHFQ